jgi:ABC-2 type transport system permease protein
MPDWLQVFARLNPLTYTVDAFRGLMITGGASIYGVGWDLIVLLGILVVLVLIGSKLYPRVVL